jgi:hypothetical protein
MLKRFSDWAFDPCSITLVEDCVDKFGEKQTGRNFSAATLKENFFILREINRESLLPALIAIP